EDDRIAGRDSPGSNRLVQRDGDRRGRGIAILIDVHVGLFRTQPQLLHGRIDDALIDLVRHNELHIVGRQLALAQRIFDEFLESPPRELVNFAAADLHVLIALGDQRFADWMAAAGLAAEHFPAMSVGMKAAVDQAARRLSPSQYNGSRAVAKEDAASAIGVIGDSAQRLGADRQYVFISPGFDEIGGRFERVDKPAACGRHVKSRRRIESKGGRHEAGGRWENHFPRYRSADDQVQIFRSHFGGSQGLARRGGSKRCGRFPISGDPTLFDARALDDPFIVGIDHARQVVVGQALLRHMTSGPRDDGSILRHNHLTTNTNVTLLPALFVSAGNAGGDLLDDSLIYPAGDKLLANPNRISDRPAIGAAVTNEAVAIDTEKRRATIFLVVVLLVNLFQHRLELRYQLRANLLKLALNRLKQALGQPFNAFEDGVADKPVAYHHVGRAFKQVASFDVTDKVNLRFVAHQFSRVFHHRGALGVFFAIGQQTDERILLSQHG